MTEAEDKRKADKHEADELRKTIKHEAEEKRKEDKKPKRNETSIYDESGYDTTPADARALAAEFVAMTLFVWCGCGAAVASQAMYAFGNSNDNTFLLGVAIAFGFAITVLAYSIAPLSGGHINPAVTLAFVVLGDLSPVMALMYVLSQFAGGLLGAALVYGTFASDSLEELGGSPAFTLGTNIVAKDYSLGSAFLGELMGTFLLVWTVLLTAVYRKNIAGNLAPLAIGFSVMLAHLVLIPITGCGINPARSFGPMLVNIMAGDKVGYEGWWIFYTAPFVGAAFAALTCKVLFGVLTDNYEGIFGTTALDIAEYESERAAAEPEQASAEANEGAES